MERRNDRELLSKLKGINAVECDDWMGGLIAEMEFHLWNDSKYLYYSLSRNSAYIGFLADFYRAWKGLKILHSENCQEDPPCEGCPSENEEIMNGLNDVVKRLDGHRMEEILLDIIALVEKNKEAVESDFYGEQLKHATNLHYYWKGMERMAFAPHLKDIQSREIGFSIFNKNRRFFHSLLPKSSCKRLLSQKEDWKLH